VDGQRRVEVKPGYFQIFLWHKVLKKSTAWMKFYKIP